MSTGIVNRTVNIFIESGEAKKAYDKLLEKQQKLTEQLEKMGDPAITDRLKTELAQLSAPIDAARATSVAAQQAVMDLLNQEKALITELKTSTSLDRNSTIKNDLEKISTLTEVAKRNSVEARKELDLLIRKEKDLEKAIRDASDPKVVERLREELTKLVEPLGRAAKKASGEFKPTLRELESVARKLNNELRNMSRNDPDYRKKLTEYAKARTELAAARLEVEKLTAAHRELSNSNPFGRILEFAKGSFLGGALLSVVQQGIGSISSFITDSFTEAFDAEEAAARLESTLDNLARTDAFDRIIKKADELAKKFKYLDNDDIIGVFNKLIDYGKLTENQMNELLPVIIDFAAKQRISVAESADVIVKALEGNGRALKQYGIDIKDSGNETDRLNIIMTTLKQKVDGAGEAFQNTAAGGVAIAKQEFANLKEELGNKLIPVLTALLGWTSKLLAGFGFLGSKIKGIAVDIGALMGIESAKDAKYVMERDQRNRVNTQAADNIANKFDGKSAKEIETEIQRQEGNLKFKENLIAAKGRLLREGALTKNDYDKEIAETAQGIVVTKSAIARLKELKELTSTKTLGISQDDSKDPKDKKRKAGKTADEFESFLKDFKRLQDEVAAIGLDAEDKELLQLTQKYDEMRKRAAGHKEVLIQLDELYFREYTNILNKYGEKETEAFRKSEAEKQKRYQQLDAQGLKALAKAGERTARQLADELDSINRNNRAKAELDFLKAHGKKKLDLELQLLNIEHRQALENKGLTENEKLLLEEKYREKREEAENNHLARRLQAILEWVQKGLELYNTIGAIQTNRENAELARDRALNDEKKRNLDDRLKKGVISQASYDRQIAKLDADRDRKEREIRTKQFKREQRAQVAATLMNSAEAAIKLWAKPGFPANIPLLAILALQTGASIGSIMSRKPEFARGGQLYGPSHAQNNGMPIINPISGEVQAFVEGGEAVVNKKTMSSSNRYTVIGTPSEIISELNGLHGVRWTSGATLVPSWKDAKPVKMDFAGLPKRFFADGGVLGSKIATTPAPAADGTGETLALMNQTLLMLAGTVSDLQQQLAGGIVAKTYLTQQEAQQDRLNAIRKEATMI